MAKTMITLTLFLVALLVSLQILKNVDGKAISNLSNEGDKIQKSPALPTGDENGELNMIRRDEKEDFALFLESRKLREGFQLLKGGERGGSISSLAPAPSLNGLETKSSTKIKWYNYFGGVLGITVILVVVGVFKYLEMQLISFKSPKAVQKKINHSFKVRAYQHPKKGFSWPWSY